MNACICVGKLGVNDCGEAIDKLISIIESNDKDWNKKSVALEAYVRHFESSKNATIEYILDQIANSPIWVSRSSGLKLLSFVGMLLLIIIPLEPGPIIYFNHLGIGVISRSDCLDKIYELLEKKLSDDPIREVRLEVGNTMRKLQLFDKVFKRMEK